MKKLKIKMNDGRTIHELLSEKFDVDFYSIEVVITFTTSTGVSVQLSVPRDKEFIIEVEV